MDKTTTTPVESKQPAAALLLTGSTQHQTDRMGLYLLRTVGNQPVYHNNRPVYKHEAREDYIYFWPEEQAWFVGPDFRAPSGWLCVEDRHVLPEDITGTWMVTPGEDEGWVEDGNVTLQPAKQPAAALLLTGITQPHTSRMGLYLLLTDDYNLPVYRNYRPVYRHEAGEQYIYFWEETQEWWVGSEIHEDLAGLRVKDSHALPEDITGTWKVALPRSGWEYDNGIRYWILPPQGSGWVEDENVTLHPVSAADLHLSGITELYSLTTGVVN